jgi:glycosyltransferase involved in cell wall biosynthesis
LREIITSGLINFVKIIIIDDGSDDDTYNKLMLNNYGDDVKIIKHEFNMGMAAGFLKFIELCDTDYYMVTADDDMLHKEGIMKLISFIRHKSPDLVSSAWVSPDGDAIRIIEGNLKIKMKDIRAAANHGPGVTYKASEARKHLAAMKKRLNSNCFATTIYPPVVLTTLIAFSNNNCWWFKEIVGGYRPSGPLDSQLLYNDEYSYVSVFGKWTEQKSFEDIYEYIYRTVEDGWRKDMANQLLIKHKLDFYYRIEEGVLWEKPELVEHLAMVAAINTIKNPILSIKRIVKYVLARYRFIRLMK